MTITTTKSVETQVEITVPSFWKNFASRSWGEYIAIIDENTAVHIYTLDEFSSVSIGTPKDLENRLSDLNKKSSICDYHPVSEEQFMAAYDDAWHSLNLRPVLSDRFTDDLRRIGIKPKEI